MILYEWLGKDGNAYRMATGIDAQHVMQPGQVYELQISEDRHFWIAMQDWNVGVRAARRTEPKGAPTSD